MENTTFVQRRSYGWGRTILTVSVLATCLKIWVGSPPLLSQAQAAQANPALQRKLALAEAAAKREARVVRRHGDRHRRQRVAVLRVDDGVA